MQIESSHCPICPLCQSMRSKIEKDIKAYRVWKCLECGLYWVPQIDEWQAETFYTADYFQGEVERGYSNYPANERNHRLNARQILRLLSGHAKNKGRLLDIGCAYGFMVHEACMAGWEAEGVEPCHAAQDYAVSQLGVKVAKGPLVEAKFPSGSFDAITLIGTIEHLADPVAVVKEVSRVIKEGGLFVITTMDTMRIMPFRIKPPEHLYYFSRDNIARLLRANGFTVERRKPYFAYRSIMEFLGLVMYVLIGDRHINPEPLLQRLHWMGSFKLPTNEMLLIARKL